MQRRVKLLSRVAFPSCDEPYAKLNAIVYYKIAQAPLPEIKGAWKFHENAKY